LEREGRGETSRSPGHGRCREFVAGAAHGGRLCQ
jgi:hypothetical protein